MNKNNISLIPVILDRYKDYPVENVELTSKETAILLYLSIRTLENWRRTRKNLSFIKSTSGVTYKLSDVLNYKNSLVINVVNELQEAA